MTMETDMSVMFDELYPILHDSVGKQMQISAKVFVGRKTLISSSREACIRGECLTVEDGGAIERALLARVPPLGGGLFGYIEDIEIVGTINRADDGFTLSDVKDAQMTSEDNIVVSIH
jgi:hypothetical protein